MFLWSTSLPGRVGASHMASTDTMEGATSIPTNRGESHYCPLGLLWVSQQGKEWVPLYCWVLWNLFHPWSLHWHPAVGCLILITPGNESPHSLLSLLWFFPSPGSMHDTGCLGWCTGTTQSDGMGREEGGGFRMGNTCIPVADSFRYLAKPIQYLIFKNKIKFKKKH